MSTRARTTIGALLLGIVAFAIPTAAGAQPPHDPGEIGGRGFFLIGYQGLDLDPLNSRLSAAALPTASADFLTLGGAGFGTFGRLLVGGEGHAIIASDEAAASGTMETRTSGGHGQFSLGYVVYSQRRFSIYPLFGIGGGAVTLDIVERGDETFDDVLADPDRSARLTASGLLLDVSIGLEMRPGFGRAFARRDGGFAIAVRGGYTFAPGDWEWTLHDKDDVFGGPDTGIEGFYVRVGVGGWGTRDDGGEDRRRRQPR
ncbi:MAG: hypothetical protein OEO23_08615 [Gemmatimonadota bacterium]|nr:hypothetical protein [Gemmatimonadota bacterium]